MPKKTRKRKTMAKRLCSCIKSVRKPRNSRKKSRRKSRKQRETDAIRICIHSVVNKKGKRLRFFTCKKSKGGPSIRFAK